MICFNARDKNCPDSHRPNEVYEALLCISVDAEKKLETRPKGKVLEPGLIELLNQAYNAIEMREDLAL